MAAGGCDPLQPPPQAGVPELSAGCRPVNRVAIHGTSLPIALGLL
jgi:hypothetical protein